MFRRKKKEIRTAKAPDNSVIYAIGDIHGRLDLLEKIHTKILEDASSRKSSRKVIIYVGDYIDRGTQSKQVIDYLLDRPMDGFEKIYLLGNHEDALLKFINNEQNSDIWLAWGGDATVRSYGIRIHDESGKARSADTLSAMLKEKIDERHMQFYKNLALMHEEGDYLFVHAGLRPSLDIDKQSKQDLTTIREDFIYSRKDFGKTIVFGHTIFDEPFNQNGRIGIDTGAYASSVLTCAIFEDDKVQFLNTK